MLLFSNQYALLCDIMNQSVKTLKTRLKNVPYKDLQIIYLKEGINSISKLHQEGKISNLAIKKALDAFKRTKSSGIDPFERWVLANFKTGIRGQPKPSIGLKRNYRAQRIHSGGPFLRLPLETLGVEKGQSISVSFDKNKIIVRKAS